MTEPNISLFAALILSGALQGLFLAVLLLVVKRNNIRVNRYLAGLIVTLSLALLNWFLAYSHYFSYAKPLIGFYTPLEIIYGPLLYLYIRGLTQPEKEKSDQQQYRHFIPIVAASFLLLPFYHLPYEQKLDLILSGFSLRYMDDEVTLYLGLFITACIISYSIYLYLSYRLLLKHQQKIPNFFSYREKITLSWIRHLIILMLIFLLLMLVFLVLSQDGKLMHQYLNGILIFSIFAILYLGTMGLLQPRVYRQIGSRNQNRQASLERKKKRAQETMEKVDKSEEKYKKSALSSAQMENILARLNQVMQTQQPYLHNNLTLPELAEMVETSPNYLSQVINEKLQINFFDYINSYRIEIAKKLLINPLPHTHTILDIAMESAFNSKSAFYSSFKKQTGLTPIQYKKAFKKI